MTAAVVALALLSAVTAGWLAALLATPAGTEAHASFRARSSGIQQVLGRAVSRHLPALASAVAAGILSYLLLGLVVPAVVIGSLGWGAARSYQRWRNGQRATQMAVSLLTASDLLAQLLPAGHSTRQALVVMAESGPVALRIEIRRILDRLDEVSLEDALTEAQLRIRQPLFTLIASALIVGNRSGGRLAPLLQELSRAAHQIEAVQGQLRAEQAQGRLGALVIALMPLALLVVLHVVNPQYLAPYSTLGGQLLLGALIAMIVVGYVWMLRILRLPQPDLLSLAPQVMPIQESIMGDLAKTASLRDVPGRATVVTFTRPAETEHLGK
ncbi:MAG: type II secretion system F family protein [Candidatus Dormiibacterota bacterium]